MLHALTAWLARVVQTLRVWGFRKYYRVSNALSWRGQAIPVSHTALDIPLPGSGIRARHYPNQRGGTKPLIVYFHGGGWVIGDLATHHPFCQALSETSGCTIIAIDYRLAPEHPFPAAQDDCVAATRWISGRVRELGPCNGQLVIAGDSAGGNLATCTCLEADDTTRRNIVGELLIYPATDHYSAGFGSYIEKATGQTLTTGIMQWFWDTYLGGRSASDPACQRAFPLRSAGMASLPPTLLVTAENDPLRDEGRAYAEKLRQAGVAVTYQHFAGAEHGFACSHGPSEDHRVFMTLCSDWLEQLGSPA